jgi:predicted Zn-dependent protease
VFAERDRPRRRRGLQDAPRRWETSSRDFDGLEDAEAVSRKAAEHTLGRRDARMAPTQELPVIWSLEMARHFVEWVLAQAASGEARYPGAAFLIDLEG